MKKFPRRFFTAAIIILFVCGITAYSLFFWSNPSGEGETIIVIPEGTPLVHIADSLDAHRLLRSRLTFRIAAKLLGAEKDIRAGSYRIEYGLTNTEIISRLSGKQYAVIFTLTIPEGSHLRKAASLAKKNLGIDSAEFMKYAADPSVLSEEGLPADARTAEGYLFPETYRFFFTVNARQLIKEMAGEWKERLNDTLRRRADTLGLTIHQLMTLASIVEAESRRADERDTIAGVYWNRLRKGMKLDADPTMQYGLQLDRPVTAAELRQDHPYNTYRQIGLPPGPINNPGIASIRAALYPAHHNFLYFVARRDGSGGHYFAENFAGQLRNIARSNYNQRK